ncbi:MAG: hypothetical protein LBC13_02440 [Clostridiales bacterium]|jgi:hypothetical protein|nr:hypothetical protein [Clostridiales bacterium]
MKKSSVLTITALIFLIAAIVFLCGGLSCSAANPYGGRADASGRDPENGANTFEAVYPKNGWLLLENPVRVTADGENIAVLDKREDGAAVFLNGSRVAVPADTKDILFFNGILLAVVPGGLFGLNADGGLIRITLNAGGDLNLTSAEFSASESELFVKSDDTVFVFGKDFGFIKTISLSYGSPDYKTTLLTAAAPDGLAAYDITLDGHYKFLIRKYAGGDKWTEIVRNTELLASEIQVSRNLAALKVQPLGTDSGVFYLQFFDLKDGGKPVGSYGAANFNVEEISDFCLLDNSLYILDGDGGRIKEYYLNGVLSGAPLDEISCIGSAGDGDLLNSPSGIVFAGGAPFIADSANKRIVSPSAAPLDLSFVPTDMSAKNNLIYVAGENSAAVIALSESASGISLTVKETHTLTGLPGGITDVEAIDGRLVLSSGGHVYMQGEKGFSELKDISGVLKTAVSEDGSLIYIFDANGIYPYDLYGIKQPYGITRDSLPSVINDFAVDYTGNIYVSDGAEITVYKRDVYGFGKTAAVTLFNDGYPLGSVSAVALGSDGLLYFTSSNHFAGVSSAISFATSENCGLADENAQFPPFPAITEAVTLDGVILYPRIGDFEHAAALSGGGNIIIFDALSDEAYSYIQTEGDRFGFIENRFLKKLNSLEPPCKKGYILPNGSGNDAPGGRNLYEYPSVYKPAPYITLDEFTYVTVSAALHFKTSSDSKWTWLKLEYGGRVYYTPSFNIAEDTDEPIVVAADAVYNKILSRKPGHYVRVYSEPGNGEVVAECRDGQRVQVLGKTADGKYVKIRAKNVVGYVGVSDLTAAALTTSETLGLVLGLIAAAAAALIFILLRNQSKKR